MVLLWTAAVGPGCLHLPPHLWRLPLCAAVARGGFSFGLRARSAAGASVRGGCARRPILLSTEIYMNLYCLITVANKIIVFLK